MKEEKIAVPAPEPIKGGPSVLPPQEEKVKIAKEPQIDGGAGSIYRPPVKDDIKLISEPEVVKDKELKTKERIVGGPGTYPEPKKEKIAISEPQIDGGAGSIYRPPVEEERKKAVKSVDPVPVKKEPLVLESPVAAPVAAPVALDGAPAPVATAVEAPVAVTAAPAQPAKSNPASDCQKLKDAAK